MYGSMSVIYIFFKIKSREDFIFLTFQFYIRFSGFTYNSIAKLKLEKKTKTKAQRDPAEVLYGSKRYLFSQEFSKYNCI